MKKLVLIVAVIFSSQNVIAQTLDEDRMNRDLEIAKNILATLMKSDSETWFEGRNLEADYVEGYGVIFTIPRHTVYFHMPPVKVKPPKVKIKGIGEGKTIVITGDENEELMNEKQKALEEAKEADKAAIAEAEAEMAEYEKAMNAEMEYWGQNVLEQNKKMEQAMITFLADYADLIGQLKTDDIILINRESPYDNYAVLWSDQATTGEDVDYTGFSMEVEKKEITSYKTGKISLDEFRNRVTIKVKESSKKMADLELFASIFKQYYNPKLSKTFFTEGTPTYEVLDNFGVIYKIRTYSSYVEGKLYTMPVLDNDKVDSDERKEIIENLFPEFENEIKNFVIDYGRTIRSLENDDMLVLKIKMTRCDECSIPKSIEVAIKMNVLKQFDQQKLSREKALAAITIKKDFESSNF